MKRYQFLYLTAVIVSLAGMLSGFDTGVISGAILYIDKSFNINEAIMGLIVSAVSLGAIFGAIFNSILVDKIGRKNILILTGLIFIIGSILSGLAWRPIILIISRFLVGMAVGAVSISAPMYLSEISIKEKRGQIVSLYQLFLTFGILFSYMVNYIFANFKYNWRIMLIFGALLGFVLLIGMLTRDDTPRFLVLKNKINEASELIKKINPEAQVEKLISEIKENLEFDKNKKVKFEKFLIYPFIIGMGLMMIQVGTGINAIIYYAPVIFKSIGFESGKTALLVTVFIGLINFIMTFVALKYSDKIGRKPLIYIGLSGMTISLIILALAFKFSALMYLSIMTATLYIVSFSMSLGPMAFVIISEVFPLSHRGLGMGSAILTNFAVNFVVTGLFPIMLDNIGGFKTFMIFTAICLVSFIFIYFVIPETKNRSLEEIEKSFRAKVS